MLSKCAECYKDNKKPSDKDCLKCENDYKRLEQKYNEVLKLAKQNADSNEFVIRELEKELEPFKDEYFNGLSNEQIAELAKKSIKLTTYNRELEKENEELKEKLGNTEILLANAESDLKFEEERTNKLEKENENLKSLLDFEVQKLKHISKKMKN